MKRTFSFAPRSPTAVVATGTALIAATYGLVRLAYGLLLPDVQAELGFDAAVAGAVSAGASIAYCVGATAGFAAATRRPRTLVAAAGLTAALGAAGMALAPTTTPFATSAVLASTGAGLTSPTLVQLVRRNATAERVERAQFVVNAGTGPGLVAAGAVALALLPSWRLAWAVAAVVAATTAALVLVADAGGRASAAQSRVLPPASWFATHRLVIAAALLMGAGSAAVWNSGRTLLVDAGAAAEASVIAWIALGFGGTAVIVTARWTSRLRPQTAWALAVGATALGTAALVTTPDALPLALAACALFGWGYTAGTGALIARTSAIDPQRAAAGTALLFVLLILGQAVGAALAGVVTSGVGLGWAFVGAAVACAVAAGLGVSRRGAAGSRG